MSIGFLEEGNSRATSDLGPMGLTAAGIQFGCLARYSHKRAIPDVIYITEVDIAAGWLIQPIGQNLGEWHIQKHPPPDSSSGAIC